MTRARAPEQLSDSKRTLLIFAFAGPPTGSAIMWAVSVASAIASQQRVAGLFDPAGLLLVVLSYAFLPPALITGAVVARLSTRLATGWLVIAAALCGALLSAICSLGLLLLLWPLFGESPALPALGYFAALGAATAAICTLIARNTKSAATQAESAVTESQ